MKVQFSAKFATINILAAFVHIAFAAEEKDTSHNFQLKKTLNLTVGTSIRTDNPDPSVIGGGVSKDRAQQLPHSDFQHGDRRDGLGVSASRGLNGTSDTQE